MKNIAIRFLLVVFLIAIIVPTVFVTLVSFPVYVIVWIFSGKTFSLLDAFTDWIEEKYNDWLDSARD